MVDIPGILSGATREETDIAVVIGGDSSGIPAAWWVQLPPRTYRRIYSAKASPVAHHARPGPATVV
jgi:hypothetical protein